MRSNEPETGIILINRGRKTEKCVHAFVNFSTHRNNGESWSLFSLWSAEGHCLIRFVFLFQGDSLDNRYALNRVSMNRFPSIYSEKLIRNTTDWTISKIKSGKKYSNLVASPCLTTCFNIFLRCHSPDIRSPRQGFWTDVQVSKNTHLFRMWQLLGILVQLASSMPTILVLLVNWFSNYSYPKRQVWRKLDKISESGLIRRWIYFCTDCGAFFYSGKLAVSAWPVNTVIVNCLSALPELFA